MICCEQWSVQSGTAVRSGSTSYDSLYVTIIRQTRLEIVTTESRFDSTDYIRLIRFDLTTRLD
jgi:hypothetical protein